MKENQLNLICYVFKGRQKSQFDPSTVQCFSIYNSAVCLTNKQEGKSACLKALIDIVRDVTELANTHIYAKLTQDMMYTSLQVNKLSSHLK